LLKRGDVVVYPYRWLGEAQRDRSEDGAKERPCALIAALTLKDGSTVAFLCAISSKPPASDQVAIEAPALERKRAGLDRYPQAWVYVSELNRDVLGASWYIAPDADPLGSFSARFLSRVATAVAGHVQGRIVNRLQ